MDVLSDFLYFSISKPIYVPYTFFDCYLLVLLTVSDLATSCTCLIVFVVSFLFTNCKLLTTRTFLFHFLFYIISQYIFYLEYLTPENDICKFRLCERTILFFLWFFRMSLYVCITYLICCCFIFTLK